MYECPLEVFDEVTRKALKKSQNNNGEPFQNQIVARTVPNLAFIGNSAKDMGL